MSRFQCNTGDTGSLGHGAFVIVAAPPADAFPRGPFARSRLWDGLRDAIYLLHRVVL